MALTLPYPNMDFVPLDILTASELDQMVANIEYIASGSVFPISATNIASNAITTAKIADNAVTSSKIDFTTMKKWVPDYTNIQALTSAQAKDYTATADGFLSLGLVKYSANQSQSPVITIKVNNVDIAKITSDTTDGSGYRQTTYTGIIPICNGERMTNDASGDMTNYGYFISGKWV